jgi:hypothetical protein
VTSAGAPAGRRRTLAIAAAIVVVLIVGALVMILLIRSSNAGGSAAIERAQATAASGLADLERRAAGQGETLDVTWSAVPSPRGDAHMVTARLELEPSGQVVTAAFVVGDAGVQPQDVVARRLAGGGQTR